MPQRITMWIYFLLIIVINVLVFMNFVIALINDCYNEVAESRVEEAFQKKCGILCELDSVFVGLAQQRNVDILVTRVSESKNEVPESGVSDTVKVLKKQLISDRIELSEKIQWAQKELISQNEQTLQKLEEAKDLLFSVFPRLKTQQTGISTQPQSMKNETSTITGQKRTP